MGAVVPVGHKNLIPMHKKRAYLQHDNPPDMEKTIESHMRREV